MARFAGFSGFETTALRWRSEMGDDDGGPLIATMTSSMRAPPSVTTSGFGGVLSVTASLSVIGFPWFMMTTPMMYV